MCMGSPSGYLFSMYDDIRARRARRKRHTKRLIVMLPGARQPARMGMEHTALKLTDPAVLRMVAAG